jgi:hypothetical protein
MSSGIGTPDANPSGRRDNGLEASSFVPVAEVDAEIGAVLLSALGRARIAAYLEATPDPVRELLYAASNDRRDARTIIEAVSRANAANRDPAATGSLPAVSPPDTLAGRDTNAEFRALTADWHVDTVAAIRSAERDLNREDAEWRARISPPVASPDQGDEEEHFIPPVPPPLPRLSGGAVLGLVLILGSVLLLLAGAQLGLGTDTTFLLGIGGILVGAGVLVMKLRPQPSEDDDDGAII